MNGPFWGELFVRSGVLLLAGEVLCRLCKRASARFRHQLLTGVFVLLALLPLMSVALPSIPISFTATGHVTHAHVTAEEVSSAISAAPSHFLNWPVIVWAAGVLIACVPLLVGAVQVRQLRQRAVISTKSELLRLSRVTEVWFSHEVRVPVTCGLLRPRILLPGAAEFWALERVEAILRHELAHIRRHDLLIQVLSHLVAALWWFQPLAWVMRHRLRVQSELASDAEVIRSGFRASTYAAELLEVARCAGHDWRLSSSAIGMVQGNDLEVRLHAILSPPSVLWKRPQLLLISLSLLASSIGASAVNVNANDSVTEPGGSMIKRTILSALLTSAGLSAATVSGYVHDLTGTAVPDAHVSMLNPDTSVKQEANTGVDGRFTLDNAGAGQFILKIDKPGLATIFRVFDLDSDAKMDRIFTMANQGGEAVPDTATSAVSEGAAKPTHVAGMVAQSNLTTKIQPVYPMAAKKAAIQGTVEIAATISNEGIPVDLRVNASPNDDLSESAIEAVRQWRYRPTLLNGQPVTIDTTIVVNYTLSK
jgi:TonB family protein